MLTFQFLNERQIVIAAQTAGVTHMIPGHAHGIGHLHNHLHYSTKGTLTPRLLLGDISNFADPTIPFQRAFKFPENWTAISSINIIPNVSPSSEQRTAPGTLFYPDPAMRVFVVSIEFDVYAIGRNQPSNLMIVLEEALLRPAIRNEPSTLLWPQWEQSCIVSNMSDEAYCFKVVGRRLIHLQSIAGKAHNLTSRLYTVEFKPPNPPRHQSATLYHHAGGPQMLCASREATMVKHRSTPSARTNFIDVYNIAMFDVNEDSIVLYDVSPSFLYHA